MAHRRRHPFRRVVLPQPFFCLAGIEFCERFNFCVLRGILSLYIMEMLMYDERKTKIIYHTFVAALYIFPLFGTILADSWIGKYITIMCSSMVCVVGNVLLAASATKPLQLPDKELGMAALTLIAIGTGGIKSCLVAFGRDQFELPEQESAMDAYFHFFYFIINMGSFIALSIAPLLRRRVRCLGQETCYPLAFFVPAVLMILAIGLFRTGKTVYKKASPEGSMLVRLVTCIWTAARNKLLTKREVPEDHWLDYALEEYGAEMVDDTKTVLPLFLVFLPLSIFWALFEQQATAWTFQARQLNGELGEYFTIFPDQVQIINPVLALMFIPICHFIIYPILSVVKMARKLLQRMATGGILAAFAFVLTAWLQYKIENFDRTIRPNGTMMHVFHLFNCHAELRNGYWRPGAYWDIRAVEMFARQVISFHQDHQVKIDSECNEMEHGAKPTGEKPQPNVNNHLLCWSTVKDVSFLCQYLKNTTRPTSNARVRVFVNFNYLQKGPMVFRFYDSNGRLYMEYLSSDDSFHDIAAGHYGVEFGCSMRYAVKFGVGGVYVVALCIASEDKYLVRNFEVVSPESISMLALLPQYVAMAAGEVMVSTSVLRFVHKEAPEDMEAVMHIVWLFYVGVGQLVVVVIEAIHFYEKYSLTYLLYAGVMIVDMFAFYIIIVCDYEYESGSGNRNIYKFTLIN